MLAPNPILSRIDSTRGAKVLIVDDNADLLKLLSMRLKPMKFELKKALSGEEALSIMSIWTPDLVITDLQMPGLDGMELFTKIHAQNPLLPVIILTAHGTIPDAVLATQSGVACFLTKPFNSKNLVEEIQSTLITSGFTPKTNHLSAKLKTTCHKDIISKSPLMQAIIHQLERFAPSDALLLFEGERGTGKNELARVAHACSSRADKPFIHMSCTSLPEKKLIEEIYGRVGKGSPSRPDRQGLLRDTNGGTLLLSDFNEGSPAFVYKLLNDLVNQRACPVDSQHEYNFDCRSMGTTSMIGRYGRQSEKSWEFGDKLDITILSVPALRHRREDIPLIANEHLSRVDKTGELTFAAKAMQLMLTTEWPGNVRQLVSVTRQCARLCKTKVISEALVNSRLSNPTFQIQTLSNAHRDFERKYLTEILKVTNGNVTKASDMAKRNRTEFHRLLKKHKIEAKSFRQ